MNSLEYKGYIGVFEFEPDDDTFHGHVEGIRDVVHFSGRSVEELRQALADSVDDYLAFCAERGREPAKPYSGQFRLRIAPDLHRAIASQAAKEHKSLNQWIADRLKEVVKDAA